LLVGVLTMCLETRRSFGATRQPPMRIARASPRSGLLPAGGAAPLEIPGRGPVPGVGAAVLALAGGASRAPLHSQLDAIGRTWVSMEAPVALARPAPRFSHAARDYLYLAPVE